MTDKKRCEHCYSKTRQTKQYIIADDQEKPRWLCKACKKELDLSVLLRLGGL